MEKGLRLPFSPLGAAFADAVSDCIDPFPTDRDLIEHKKRVATCTKALKDLEGPVPKEPQVLRPLILHARCAAYRGLQQLNLALADCNNGVRLDPSNLLLYWTRGGVHLDKKMYDAAIADFTTVLASHGGDAFIYYDRGSAYAAKGDRMKAIADYREASSECRPTSRRKMP